LFFAEITLSFLTASLLESKEIETESDQDWFFFPPKESMTKCLKTINQYHLEHRLLEDVLERAPELLVLVL